MAGWKTERRGDRRGSRCLGEWPGPCDFWAENSEEMWAHWDSGVHDRRRGEREAEEARRAEEATRLRRDLELAIYEARREGYARALADVDEELARLVRLGGQGRVEHGLDGWLRHRFTDNRDERVEKPWLDQELF